VPRTHTTISCRFVALIALSVTLSAATRATAQPSTTPQTPFPSTIVWSVEIPSAPAGPPVVSGDRVVVATLSGQIVARHVADGTEAWTAAFAATSALAAGDGLVLVPVEGAIHALAIGTGHRLWSVDTTTLTAPPLLEGGWVIVAAGEQLTAFSASSGNQVWTKKIALIEQRSAIAGDALFVARADGRVAALDLQTGSLRWERVVGANPTEPFPFGDRVYVGAKGTDFVCLNLADGSEDWRFSIGAAIRGTADADASRVYTVSMDNLLRAFNRSTGAREWKQDIGYRPSSGPIVIGSTVAVAGRSAVIRAFDSASRKVVAQLTLPDPAVVAPGLVRPPAGSAALAIVTGDPGKPWLLSLTGEPPPAMPAVSPLTALPGEALPAMKPPGL
jgi:outer membrane protein assembly factor BamB